MSPPDDSDLSLAHAPPDSSRNLPAGSGHRPEIDCSAVSSNGRVGCGEPENVVGSARIEREMLELDRVLDRIRLRCMDLASVATSTSGASSLATGTVTSSDTASSSSSTRAVTSTDCEPPPCRRAAVPRMGIRRRYPSRPIEDISARANVKFEDLSATGRAGTENATPTFVSTQLDENPAVQTSDSLSNPAASHARRSRCDTSTNCSCEEAGKGAWAGRPPEPENWTSETVTVSFYPEDISAAPRFSSSSTRVTGARHRSSENSTAIISAQDGNCCSTANQLRRVSRQLTYTSGEERNRLSDAVDSTPSSMIQHTRSSPAKDAWVITPSKTDTYNVGLSFPPHQVSSSWVDSVAGRSPERGRKLDGIGNRARGSLAIDRDSVPDRQAVLDRHAVPDRSNRSLLDRSSRSSQTDEVNSEHRQGHRQRRELYWRYADVLYTNADNLEHTMAIQQALFRQQLGTGVTREQQQAPAEVIRPRSSSDDSAACCVLSVFVDAGPIKTKLGLMLQKWRRVE